MVNTDAYEALKNKHLSMYTTRYRKTIKSRQKGFQTYISEAYDRNLQNISP